MALFFRKYSLHLQCRCKGIWQKDNYKQLFYTNTIQCYCKQADSKLQTGVSTSEGWKWREVARGCVPVALCLVAVMQWRAYRKWQQESQKTAPNWQINLYRALPLRTMSRVWGRMAERQVPEPLRPIVLGLYATAFGVNLSEAESTQLKDYPSLAAFFSRGLQPGARPQDPAASLTAPCDGTLLHCGPVCSGKLEQVKGVTYSCEQFLGEEIPRVGPNSCLYQCILYLAPGDYHRFHSPTEWQTQSRRHFSGELLSVSPRFATRFPDLFCMNERAVYAGRWRYGFFALAAVGATNVGSVRVYVDPALRTNLAGAPCGDCVHRPVAVRLERGQPLGEFRMGSTIVLLFEAPKDFRFCLAPGQKIKVGQALGLASQTVTTTNS